jgi:hypothetical protein
MKGSRRLCVQIWWSCIIFIRRYNDSVFSLLFKMWKTKVRICFRFWQFSKSNKLNFKFGVGAARMLKGQCHEIFDPRFFSSNKPHGPLIHGLKSFWILLRIRRDMINFRTQKSCMRCQWHRLHFKKIRISSRIRIYIRKDFSPLNQGPRKDVFMKKIKGRKSRDTVPLRLQIRLHHYLAPWGFSLELSRKLLNHLP